MSGGDEDDAGTWAHEAAEFADVRRAMVNGQLRARGIGSETVLEAMLKVPRHAFVAPELRSEAYEDKPLPIGEGQTISQPFMVGAMCEALELSGTERVLEVGTGSGYQAAVLALLAREVFTIESHPSLTQAARQRLEDLGCSHVHVYEGDGTLGLPEAAPFDAIVVAAAAPQIPPPLTEQLAEEGRLVIPVGGASEQELVQVKKIGGQLRSRALHYCRFVPLVGYHGWRAKQ